MAIADSGTTGHYLKSNSPCVEKQIARIPLPIRMPNGEIIQSSHTALLPQTNIPIEARKAHIFQVSKINHSYQLEHYATTDVKQHSTTQK